MPAMTQHYSNDPKIYIQGKFKNYRKNEVSLMYQILI